MEPVPAGAALPAPAWRPAGRARRSSGREEFGGEVHVYAPAYSAADLDGFLEARRPRRLQFARPSGSGCAGRPSRARARWPVGCASTRSTRRPRPRSTIPARRARASAITRPSSTPEAALEGISGSALPHPLRAAATRSSARWRSSSSGSAGIIPRAQWVNFGGGHHITRPGYDVDRLVRVISDFRERTAWRCTSSPARPSPSAPASWWRRCSTSSTTPWTSPSSTPAPRPTCPTCSRCRTVRRSRGRAEPGEKAHTYRLGGLTCLAGDVIGDYSFDEPARGRAKARASSTWPTTRW